MIRLWSASAPYRRRVGSEYARTASVFSFNHDGLEIARVKRRNRPRWMPVWHIVFFIYLIMLIRLVALADVGPAGYALRMDEMRHGNVLEQAAAGIMDMDPLSRRLAANLRGLVNFISGD